MEPDHPIRSRLAPLALLAVSTLLALGVAEVAVRVAGSAPAVKAIWLSDDENVYRRSENPILGFELKPNYRNAQPNPNHSYPSTNAWGQRDVERTLAKPDVVTRVLLLGDSVVEGHGIMDLDSTISRQLEQLLRDESFEVLNFGVSGYCTLSEIEMLETRGLRFDPDIVILVFTRNDFRNFNPIAFDLEVAAERPAWVRHLFLASHLFRLAALRLHLFGFGEEPQLTAWNDEAIGDNNVVEGLRRFAELARSHRFRPLVAIWPERIEDRLVDEPTMDSGEELIIERLAGMFGLGTLRLSEALEGYLRRTPGASARQLFLTGDPLHPSPLGCTVAAEALAEALGEIERHAPMPTVRSVADAAAIAAARELGVDERSTDARVLNNRGRRLREGGRLGEAEVVLLEALESDPELPEAHFNLGVVYQGQERIEAAAAAYREALRLDPENEEAHYNLGLLLLDAKAFDEALEHFERAAVIEPDYAHAYLGIGNACVRLGRMAEARGAFQQAVNLDPDDVAARNNLGNSLLAEQRAADAIPHYRYALELAPDHFNARYNLGYALELTGKTADAIGQYRQALRLRPDHPAPRRALERLGVE